VIRFMIDQRDERKAKKSSGSPIGRFLIVSMIVDFHLRRKLSECSEAWRGCARIRNAVEAGLVLALAAAFGRTDSIPPFATTLLSIWHDTR